MFKMILLAVGVMIYLSLGVVVLLFKFLVNFYLIHKKLEPENLEKDLPIEEHVKTVIEKLQKEKTWIDNGILVVLFWPLYLKKKYLPILDEVAKELLDKNDTEALVGIINYLDPADLATGKVGEIYSGGRVYLFNPENALFDLEVGQRVSFELDSNGIAINVVPIV